MKGADIISAAGSTTSELAFLGIPMLLIAIADNQRGIMDGFHRGGAARALGWYEGVTAKDIAYHLEQLVFGNEKSNGKCRTTPGGWPGL